MPVTRQLPIIFGGAQERTLACQKKHSGSRHIKSTLQKAWTLKFRALLLLMSSRLQTGSSRAQESLPQRQHNCKGYERGHFCPSKRSPHWRQQSSRTDACQHPAGLLQMRRAWRPARSKVGKTGSGKRLPIYPMAGQREQPATLQHGCLMCPSIAASLCRRWHPRVRSTAEPRTEVPAEAEAQQQTRQPLLQRLHRQPGSTSPQQKSPSRCAQAWKLPPTPATSRSCRRHASGRSGRPASRRAAARCSRPQRDRPRPLRPKRQTRLSEKVCRTCTLPLAEPHPASPASPAQRRHCNCLSC